MANRKRHIITASLVIAATLLALQLATPGRQNLLVQELMNSAHFGIFAFIAVTCLAFTGSHLGFGRRAVVAFVLATALGFVSEAVQFPTQRDASLGDLFSNTAGALAGLLVANSFRRGGSVFRRLLGVLLALLVSCIALWPLLSMVHAYNVRAGLFPTIVAFEESAELTFLETGGAPLRIEELAPGSSCGRLASTDGQPIGLAHNEVEADWTGYASISLRIRYDGDESLRTVLRVNDRQHELGDQAHADRFNTSIELVPGWNLVEIPLAEVFAAPATRTMDAAAMSRLVLFANDEGGPVCVDRIWLD